MSKTSSFVASSTCKQSPSPPRRTLPRSRSQTLLNHGGTTVWPNLNPYFSPRRNYTSCIHLRKMNVSNFFKQDPTCIVFFLCPTCSAWRPSSNKNSNGQIRNRTLVVEKSLQKFGQKNTQTFSPSQSQMGISQGRHS